MGAIEPPQLECTREYKEVAWLVHQARKGERLAFPHRVDVEDRRPNWRSVNDPPCRPLHRSREIVLLELEEESPGVWAAETLVDALPERLVVRLPEQGGPCVLLEGSVRLHAAFEFTDVERVLVQASKGQWPELPLRIPRGLPIWERNKSKH